jgi:hypothetical protein
MRGMNTKDSAQKIIEAMRIHYNFCREHTTLGKTPAEASGLKLDLQGIELNHCLDWLLEFRI